MSLRPFNKVGYGLSDALTNIFASPIVAKRAPLTADRGELGQVWVDTIGNDAYICTSIVAGSTTWQSLAGDAVTFTDLDVTNDLTVGNDVTVTAGNLIFAAGGIAAAAGAITGLTLDALDEVTAVNEIRCTAGDFVASGALQGITLGGGARVLSGAGSPNTVVNAPQGSLYLRTDGSSTSTRAYINTNGATAWTNVTTAA